MIKINIRTVIITAIAVLFLISLASAATDYDKISKHKKAKFYSERSHYHNHQDVKFALKNEDKKRSIFIPCEGIISVKNKKYGNIVAEVPWELDGDGCDVGYGYDGDGMFELKPRHKIKQSWDQTDENGDLVSRGKYKAYTDYFDEDDRHIFVNTNTFELKK